MPYCTRCGSAVADTAAFCASCGAPQTGSSADPAVAAAAQPQMSEDVAGVLCYLVGWITGIIFYCVDKRPYVRFHAAQSIVTFGGLNVLSLIAAGGFGFRMVTGGIAGLSSGRAFYVVVNLVSFILWIVLMIKAYHHDRFRLPLAADLAEKIFGKF